MCRGFNVKVISFDLTGTLVSNDYVDYFWLELIPKLYAEKHGVSLDEAKRIVYSSYDEIGSGDIRWYIPQYWLERFGLGLSAKDAISMVKDKVYVYDDVLDTLNRLACRYDLVVSSNLSKEFIDVVLDVLGFKGFKAVFSCVSDLSLTIKSPDFYRFIAERLGVLTCEVLHVGDDPERDYENPVKAGMRALLIARSGEPPTSGYRCIRSLMELLDLLS